MSQCVFENCEREGGQLKIKFTGEQTGERFVANVKMCLECYETLWAVKKNTGQLPRCDIEYSTKYTGVAFEGVSRTARVTTMRKLPEVTNDARS